MTPQQLTALKQNMINQGILPPGASEADAANAMISLQQNNPALLQSLMEGSGGFPWLTMIGLGAGAVAIYLVWSHYTKTKKLGEIDRPEPSIDVRHRLRGYSKSLSRLKPAPMGRRMGGCKRLGRGLGDADYEFEPEIRLEGYRGLGRHKGARR